MIEINSRFEYDYCISRGFNPLHEWRLFKMDFRLRMMIQYELFGTADFKKQNQRFYEYCWNNFPHYCQETGKPLNNYSSVYVSHIISRGSDRRMAIDPRNVNILCYEQHQNWEFSNRKRMNIYPMNQLIIKLLKQDYE